MSPTQPVLPDGWPRPSGYSQAIIGTGDKVLKLAGQIGRDERSGQVLDGFVAQWGQALENVVTVVRAAGGDAENILSLRLYVTDVEQYKSAQQELGEPYLRAMGRHFPAITMVEITSLMEPHILLEIEAEAVL